jgi:hypothetical protein
LNLSMNLLERESSVPSEIVCELVGLRNHLDDWSLDSKYTNTDVCAREMGSKIEQLLEEYYSCDFVIAAVILDRSLGSNWKKLIPEPLQDLGLSYIKSELEKLDPDWSKQYTQRIPNTPSRTSLGRGFKQSIESTESRTELDLYFASDLPSKSQSTLEWWCEKKSMEMMPYLSMIARRLFAIPGSAAMSERTWSTVGHIWSPLRNRLLPETVEMLTVLRSNSDKW